MRGDYELLRLLCDPFDLTAERERAPIAEERTERRRSLGADEVNAVVVRSLANGTHQVRFGCHFVGS